jgi:hypothetical protein
MTGRVSGQSTLSRARTAAGAAAALLLLGAAPAQAAPAGPMPVDGAARLVSVQGSTTMSSLRAAVGRIPGYRAHRPARWVVTASCPNWGQTDWYHNTICISPGVPGYYLDSVVRHEWSHILQARDYHLNISLLVRALDHRFGGPGKSGIRGAEYSADCMAIELGATWTYYTRCAPPAWRRAAAQLLHGRALR